VPAPERFAPSLSEPHHRLVQARPKARHAAAPSGRGCSTASPTSPSSRSGPLAGPLGRDLVAHLSYRGLRLPPLAVPGRPDLSLCGPAAVGWDIQAAAPGMSWGGRRVAGGPDPRLDTLNSSLPPRQPRTAGANHPCATAITPGREPDADDTVMASAETHDDLSALFAEWPVAHSVGGR
jgi:hypothetical protein